MGIILPKAIVAVRYTVLWEVPRDSRDLLTAIEDIVVFLNYLQKVLSGPQ